MNDRVYYVWLSLALGADNAHAPTLFSRFGDIKSIYDCDDFSPFERIPTAQRKRLENKSLDSAMEICAVCESKGYGILTRDDEDYPERLRIISTPPTVLYYRGNIKGINSRCLISVVGTRDMTEHGGQTTRSFARVFAESGAGVVSGMASGIDAEAHRGCLSAGGFTAAILGTGIDKPYPRENEKLYYDIAESGVVLSEFAPGSPVSRFNFPIRNRLISGISCATVVTEAGEHSGALITARLAVMQGKTVYALPGLPGSEQSAGTNMLLQRGVNLAYRPSDVLSKLELLYPDKIRISANAYRSEPIKPAPVPERRESFTGEAPSLPRLNNDIGELEPAEKAIIEALGKNGAMLPDSIISYAGMDTSEVMSSLTVLELYGMIEEDSSGKYRLS